MGRKKKKIKGISKKLLTNNILGVFSNNPKKTYNYKQLARNLKITNTLEKKHIIKVLNKLRDSGDLEEIYNGKFKLKSKSGYIVGQVEITNAGYGFVIC